MKDSVKLFLDSEPVSELTTQNCLSFVLVPNFLLVPEPLTNLSLKKHLSYTYRILRKMPLFPTKKADYIGAL